MDWKVIEPAEMDAVVDLLDVSFPVNKDFIKRDLAEIMAAPRENGKIHRLRRDGELIATAIYGQVFGISHRQLGDDSWNGESIIRYFAVHPDHRRKGYATWIIQKIMDETQALGSPCLCVSVLKSDIVVADIWKRRGFELYATTTPEDCSEYGPHDSYVYWFGDK